MLYNLFVPYITAPARIEGEARIRISFSAKEKLVKSKSLVALFTLALIVPLVFLVGCSKSDTQPAGQKAPGTEQAVADAVDAYVYGYPLVTMDMTRRQFTNVSTPDAAHAPMGQMLKLRNYPAVDNHAVTAPNADTLYTTAWLDVTSEPWIFSVPDMGDRYYLLPMLSGWTDVFQVPGKRTTGGKAQVYAITGP